MLKDCFWTEDEDGNWETTCGNMFILIDGMPSENDMKYCCYCGCGLKEVPFEEDEVEDE